MRRGRTITAVIIAVMAALLCASTGLAADSAPSVETVSLGRCSVKVYDFGGERLHAFSTNDELSDECFIVEGRIALVGIELPPLTADLDTWRSYVRSLEKPMVHILLANHAAGGRFVEGMKVYATAGAKESIESGAAYDATMALADRIPGWERGMAEITDVIEPDQGTLRLGGMTFEIVDDGASYMIGIPSMRAFYVHMYGGDTHNILPSVGVIDGMIGLSRWFIENDIELILSSHHEPEGPSAAVAKIGYLERTKEIAAECANADDFRAAMKKAFPHMLGENYLDMTAVMLYPME